MPAMVRFITSNAAMDGPTPNWLRLARNRREDDERRGALDGRAETMRRMLMGRRSSRAPP